MRIKKRIKIRQEKFYFMLLDCIDNGLSLTQTASKLNLSKPALSYHLRKQRALKTVRRIQSYPYAIYELTSLGKRIKKILVQSEKLTPLFRCHDLIAGFKILDFGNFNFINTKRRKICKMNNWIYAYEKQGDYVIHIQKTGLLKIYCPEIYSVSPDDAFGKMFARAQGIAQFYCDKYDMKLEADMKVVRKGHKSLLNSNSIGKLLGKVNLKKFWVDESLGSEELEAHHDDYTIESLLSVPKLMKQNIHVMREFTRQIELHLKVLNKINKNQEEFNKLLKEKRI